MPEQTLKVVYAKERFMIGPSGYRTWVQAGTHWPADDPVVLQNPTGFSADPRYGLSYSTPPAGVELLS